MAQGVDFDGSNITFLGGRENINDIRAFQNQQCVVTCWELTDEEIELIIQTRRVYVSQFYGGNLVPHYVAGSEDDMKAFVADYGGAW